MKHKHDYELLPESELDEELLKESLTRDNYVDKFHTLLYYEEHEHVRVLKERLKCWLHIASYTSIVYASH